MPDIAVIYYYTQNGKNYKATHNWNMVEKLMLLSKTQDQKCWVYGYAEHLIVDSQFHTKLVPEVIRSYYLPNEFIHPLTEKKYDTIQVMEHPELMETTPHMLDIMWTAKGEEYFKMFEKALGENSQMDVRAETAKLGAALGSFYTDAYNPNAGTNVSLGIGDWMFTAYPAVDKFTNAIAPALAMSNVGKADMYFRRAKDETTNIFNNWGSRYDLSPHGRDELDAANKAVLIPSIIILSMILLIPLALVFAWPKIWITKQKRAWWFLALVPAFFIIFILIVYTLL
jgi:hypothetical protein